jgi:hypothetical protein
MIKKNSLKLTFFLKPALIRMIISCYVFSIVLSGCATDKIRTDDVIKTTEDRHVAQAIGAGGGAVFGSIMGTAGIQYHTYQYFIIGSTLEGLGITSLLSMNTYKDNEYEKYFVYSGLALGIATDLTAFCMLASLPENEKDPGTGALFLLLSPFYIVACAGAGAVLGLCFDAIKDGFTAKPVKALKPVKTTVTTSDLHFFCSVNTGSNISQVPIQAFTDTMGNPHYAYTLSSVNFLIQTGLENNMGTFPLFGRDCSWGIKGKLGFCYSYWHDKDNNINPFDGNITFVNNELDLRGYWIALTPELTLHVPINDNFELGGSVQV